MKHLYQFILTGLSSLLLFNSVYAAVGDQYHEITGNFNVLRSSLAPLTNGTAYGGMGFGGGAGYAYHFNAHLSFWTGAEVNIYNGNSLVSNISEESKVDVGDKWEWQTDDKTLNFNTDIKNYNVKQSAMYVQIPLMLGYEGAFPWMDWLKWYTRGGFKVGYSISGTSSASADSAHMSGKSLHYGDYSLENEFLGFGAMADCPDASTPLNLGVSGIGYFELGVKQTLASHLGLYIGIFGEYSLYSAISGATSERIYDYEPQTVEDGFYKLTYTPASHTTTYQSKKLFPMSFGITLRFSFDTKRDGNSNNRMLQMRFLDF
ncbi:MAG: hypothetical protein LBT94_06635 [Prevotellaceae bacterium]|jgi:hypothetical protein|nr:hypothetical protein [Prevotellaceae bacterium]